LSPFLQRPYRVVVQKTGFSKTNRRRDGTARSGRDLPDFQWKWVFGGGSVTLEARVSLSTPMSHGSYGHFDQNFVRRMLPLNGRRRSFPKRASISSRRGFSLRRQAGIPGSQRHFYGKRTRRNYSRLTAVAPISALRRTGGLRKRPPALPRDRRDRRDQQLCFGRRRCRNSHPDFHPRPESAALPERRFPW